MPGPVSSAALESGAARGGWSGAAARSMAEGVADGVVAAALAAGPRGRAGTDAAGLAAAPGGGAASAGDRPPGVAVSVPEAWLPCRAGATAVSELAVARAGGGAAAEALLAVAGCCAAGCRSSIQDTTMILMPRSTAIAMAHTGSARRGGAILTSKSDGPVCRCRSVSDFFNASRMNDMMATRAPQSAGEIRGLPARRPGQPVS